MPIKEKKRWNSSFLGSTCCQLINGGEIVKIESCARGAETSRYNKSLKDTGVWRHRTVAFSMSVIISS